jgi:hypothetical protein
MVGNAKEHSGEPGFGIDVVEGFSTDVCCWTCIGSLLV